MSNNNITLLPEAPKSKSTEQILEEDKELYGDIVVVFGFNQEGDIECMSNAGSLAFVNLMVDQFKADLVNYHFDNLDD